MKKQVHVYYAGQVQGVGFRFTVESAANELGIFGWVKNLPGGGVEIVAEGEETALKELLFKINLVFSRYIINTETKWLSPTGQYNSFAIKL